MLDGVPGCAVLSNGPITCT